MILKLQALLAKKIVRKIVVFAVLLTLTFYAGRAYGWYEADLYMQGVARSLGVQVQ